MSAGHRVIGIAVLSLSFGGADRGNGASAHHHVPSDICVAVERVT